MKKLSVLGNKLYYKELKEIFKDPIIKNEILIRPDQFKTLLKMEDRGVNIISFNIPQKLNALDFDSIREIFTFYETYEINPEKLIIFIGDKSCKMFCSGADLKYVYQQRNTPEEYYKYFNVNYYLFDKNYEYSQKKRNIIAIWNGITMGGGLGHTIHSKYRIATESTLLAMPEAQFGYYTNCNYADFIHRFISKEEALYMSLFSHRYKGYEVLEKKFATHFVLNKYLRNLIGDIRTISDSSNPDKELERCIRHYHFISLKEYEAERSKISEDLEKFDTRVKELFNFQLHSKNFEKFYENLSQNLQKQSDPNEKIFYENFKSASLLTHKLNFDIALSSYDSKLTYEDRFNLDSDSNKISIDIGNMFEGIRAYFVDKDKSPKWKIKSIEELKQYNLL
jgi:enoyl-CoA hydratase/carnithine racemase